MSTSGYIHKVRVYWEDTDAGGIVFYANYLKYFERARTEWLRSLGVAQQKLKEELGCMFVVSETHVKYLLPAILDDELEIETTITEKGKSSLTLEQKAYRYPDSALVQTKSADNYNSGQAGTALGHQTQVSKQLLCTGTIRIGWINSQSGRPARIPSFIQEIL